MDTASTKGGYARNGAVIGGVVAAPAGVLTGLGHRLSDVLTSGMAFRRPKARSAMRSIGAGSAVIGSGVVGGAVGKRKKK